jgi:hypothetical protein
MKIVVDDQGIDWLARNIDQARPREPQKHQHEEHTLFIMVNPGYALKQVYINRKAGYYDNTTIATRIRENVPKLHDKPPLEGFEDAALFR